MERADSPLPETAIHIVFAPIADAEIRGICALQTILTFHDSVNNDSRKNGTVPRSPTHPYAESILFYSRRLLRSSRPHEIFQPPQQGFYSVHAQLQLLGKIFQLFTPPPHLISTHLTLAFINNIILHLFLVLCTAVNVRIKNLCV